MKILVCVFCALWVGSFGDLQTYRAAIARNHHGPLLERYSSMIQEASKYNVDLLVLPSPPAPARTHAMGSDRYDEIVKSLAFSAYQAGIYVVAHAYEKTWCENKNEVIRNTLVFDREGSITAAYRKPVSTSANCTISPALTTFTTDFGTTFGVLMEEDFVLQNVEGLKGLKNFVMSGAWDADVPLLKAPQFSLSWAYMMDSNLVTSDVILVGKAGAVGTQESSIIVADLYKDSPRIESPSKLSLSSKPITQGEDLSQYILRPLDLQASVQGYNETVCHEKFCCEFYVKTDFDVTTPTPPSYGLAAFSGARRVDSSHHVGVHSCAVFACAGLYKRSCGNSSQTNSTDLHFSHISVTANFPKEATAHFPILLSTDSSFKDVKFDSVVGAKTKVTLTADNSQNVYSFGVIGRDYEADFKLESKGFNFYNYFFDSEIDELFDYMWIRIRVLLFVVSIYVLEML